MADDDAGSEPRENKDPPRRGLSDIPEKRANSLRNLKPCPKGVSGNPGGRPKTAELNRLARKYAKKELRAWLEKMPFEGSFAANARAKALDTAMAYSGALTGPQQISALERAAKMRGEFPSEREWLLFVRTVAGHDVEESLAAATPPKPAQVEQKPTAVEDVGTDE